VSWGGTEVCRTARFEGKFCVAGSDEPTARRSRSFECIPSAGLVDNRRIVVDFRRGGDFDFAPGVRCRPKITAGEQEQNYENSGDRETI